jgi:hypothetical protein
MQAQLDDDSPHSNRPWQDTIGYGLITRTMLPPLSNFTSRSWVPVQVKGRSNGEPETIEHITDTPTPTKIHILSREDSHMPILGGF